MYLGYHTFKDLSSIIYIPVKNNLFLLKTLDFFVFLCYTTCMNTISVVPNGTLPVEAESNRGHSWQTKLDVVARYMLLGNLRVVSEQLEIPYQTLADWKRSEWWPEMVDQIRRQKKQKTADTIGKVIETSVEILQDRLENGDWVFDQKTGQTIRKPVSAKDAQTIANQLLQRQIQLEEIVDKTSHKQETVQETLAMLAKEFSKMNRRGGAETIEYVEKPSAIHDEREA